VNASLTSFKAVMTELGLTGAQQSTVVTSVQTKAQELTTQLGLADDTSYSGTVLEKLTSMFSDLTDYAVAKIAEVAPNLDEPTISNAVASFATELLASASEQNILSSLPEAEQQTLPIGADGRFDVQETLGSTVAQAAVGSMVAARPTVKPEEVMAAISEFGRRPGEQPQPPAQVREFRPSEAQRQAGRSKVEGDLCQGKSESLGVGSGRTADPAMADWVAVPMCPGVFIDKVVTFCLTAPVSAMKFCAKNSYGAAGSAATKTSIKFKVDGVDSEFTSFAAGKVYDCADLTARKELAQLFAAALKEKKATCSAFVPPSATVNSSAPPGSQMPPSQPSITPN
jgi:hypothetical protein